VKDIVSKEILDKFPQYIRAVVVARGVDNHGEKQGLVELLRKVENDATQDESLLAIKNHPRIACWRQTYSDLGSNPNKFYSSIESLARRARRGDQLSYINTLVAIFNYFSLKNMAPSGGDDLDMVDGKLHLTFAEGDEPFTPFNSDIVENPEPGEVIFMDNTEVMCRRWNWRQGDKTKITPETANVAINIDCLPPILRQEAEELAGELAGLVKEFCGGDVEYYLLDINQNEIEF